jgi:hypothetical protein
MDSPGQTAKDQWTTGGIGGPPRQLIIIDVVIKTMPPHGSLNMVRYDIARIRIHVYSIPILTYRNRGGARRGAGLVDGTTEKIHVDVVGRTVTTDAIRSSPGTALIHNKAGRFRPMRSTKMFHWSLLSLHGHYRFNPIDSSDEDTSRWRIIAGDIDLRRKAYNSRAILGASNSHIYNITKITLHPGYKVGESYTSGTFWTFKI